MKTIAEHIAADGASLPLTHRVVVRQRVASGFSASGALIWRMPHQDYLDLLAEANKGTK